jgi:hypothetical protein
MVMRDRHGSLWACLCKFRNALSIISNPFMGAPQREPDMSHSAHYFEIRDSRGKPKSL